jgi:hypothetical protein
MTRPHGDAPIFLLKLQAEPGAAGIRALRWALKVLLRKYKLRCVSIEELGASEIACGYGATIKEDSQ